MGLLSLTRVSFLFQTNFTAFHRLLPVFTGFYWVLLGFTGFHTHCRVLMGLFSSIRVSFLFKQILLHFIGFYWVLLGFIGFSRIPMSCIGKVSETEKP